MKEQRKHKIAREAVERFFRPTGGPADSRPVSFTELSLLASERYRLVIQTFSDLNIETILSTMRTLDLPVNRSLVGHYSSLAGFMYACNGTGMIFIEENDSEERRRFTLAHELGHFINDYYRPIYLKYENSNTIPLFQKDEAAQTHQVVSARCTKKDVFGEEELEIAGGQARGIHRSAELHREQREKFKEIKANLFAAELLMPMEDCKRIEHECDGATKDELVAELVKRFGVSRSAALIRVEELLLGEKEGRLF